jgi:hypothetical protein
VEPARVHERYPFRGIIMPRTRHPAQAGPVSI